jgi:ankyrin repeat protein
MHLAVMFCDTGYASALIEDGADVDAQAWPDFTIMYWFGTGALTPISCAIRNRHENMIRLLVSKGATLATSQTSSPALALVDRPLHSSDDAPDIHSMITCFKHLGWEIDLPVDDLGRCMLHVAAESNNLELMRALIAHGSSTCVRDKHGSVALQTAARHLDHASFMEIAKLLLETSPSEQLENKDDAGQTILHHIVADRDRPYYEQTVWYLIARGSSVLSQDDHGNTPLNVAISNWCDGGVIRSLLRIRTAEQLCVKNLQRQTPLQIALAANTVRAYVVLDLLAAGADPLDTDSIGYTPAQHIHTNSRPHGGQDPSRVLDSEVWDQVWEVLMKKPSLRKLFAGLDRLDGLNEEVTP